MTQFSKMSWYNILYPYLCFSSAGNPVFAQGYFFLLAEPPVEKVIIDSQGGWFSRDVSKVSYNVRPPRQLSWFITPITMVYSTYNYSYWGL